MGFRNPVHSILHPFHRDTDPNDVPLDTEVVTFVAADDEWESAPGGGGGGTPGNTPTAIDVGDAQVGGADSTYSRNDHQHQFAAPGAGYPIDVAAAESDGVATTPARSDHGHGHGSGYAPDAHHAQAHAIGGADHSGAIAAAQHGALAAIVGAHGHDDLDTVSADQHHAQVHAIDGANHTGDIETAQIAANAVTLAKLADIATARLLGRITGGSGDPEELTGTQATTLLDAFTALLKGLAPASGGGTTNFLRADGTWAAPGGGSGAPTDAQYVVLALNGSLSAERVLTEGDGLQLVDGGADGAATLSVQTFLANRFTASARVYTNLGAGPTENVSDRMTIDLTNTDEVRIVAHVTTAGVTGDVKGQYSTVAAPATFNDLTTLIDLSTTGIKASAWQAVPAGAKGLVNCRMVGVNGNGTEDPVVGSGVSLEFR
jgi:hypothetical protein